MTTDQKVALVESTKDAYGLNLSLATVDLPKSTRYYRRKHKIDYEDKYAHLLPILEEIAREHPEYGVPRIMPELREKYGVQVNHKVVERLLGIRDLVILRNVHRPSPSGIQQAITQVGKLANLVAQMEEIGLFQVVYTDFTELVYADGQRKAMLIPIIGHASKMAYGWSCQLSSCLPTPALLMEAAEEEVYQVLWKTGCYQHARRVAELQALARDSSGLLPDPGRVWRLEWLTGFLLTNFQYQASLDKRVQELVKQWDGYELIANVPYSGPATLGVILAVTGDVSRFSNYRKYVAYTGYFAGLEKSQTIDRTKMSRRGNRNMKRALFQIAAPLVWFDKGDNPYKQLYQRKIAEGREWYKAMPFVCAALARHIYHCLKFNDPYDVEKAVRGSVTSPASEEKWLSLGSDLDEKFETMEASLCLMEG